MRNNIIKGYPIPQKDYYKVDVRSITYNHSKYIEECLNGVAMQKTDFPFVHHVIDDCSTDGEQEVIKAWIERECDLETAGYYDNDICTITLAKHKSNPNYTIAAYCLKKNMYGNPKRRELYKPWEEVCPYIALCEGDDFWIATDKLQRQVGFMESNIDYSLCIHNYSELIDDRFFTRLSPFNKTGEISTNEIIVNAGSCCSTNAMLFRSCILSSAPRELFKQYVGDLPLKFYMAMNGRVWFINENMCVYRRGSHGSWTMRNRFITKQERFNMLKKNSKMLTDFDNYSQHKYIKELRCLRYRELSNTFSKIEYNMMALKFLIKHDFIIARFDVKGLLRLIIKTLIDVVKLKKNTINWNDITVEGSYLIY